MDRLPTELFQKILFEVYDGDIVSFLKLRMVSKKWMLNVENIAEKLNKVEYHFRNYSDNNGIFHGHHHTIYKHHITNTFSKIPNMKELKFENLTIRPQNLNDIKDSLKNLISLEITLCNKIDILTADRIVRFARKLKTLKIISTPVEQQTIRLLVCKLKLIEHLELRPLNKVPLFSLGNLRKEDQKSIY